MPHKHNAARRHHIGKMKFKVTNWAEYEAGLLRRGGFNPLDYARSAGGLGSPKAQDAWWQAALFGSGDRKDADAGHGIWAAAAPERRTSEFGA